MRTGSRLECSAEVLAGRDDAGLVSSSVSYPFVGREYSNEGFVVVLRCISAAAGLRPLPNLPHSTFLMSEGGWEVKQRRKCRAKGGMQEETRACALDRT